MKQKATEFEKMLMWTSYRYCIGRKSYVSCMADDIGVNYYNKLDDKDKEFSAADIRRSVYDKLRFTLPFKFDIQRWSDENFNPVQVLMNFIEKEHIKSWEELRGYSNIEYNSYKDEYIFDKCTPSIKSYFSASDVDDLLIWDKLASLFDVKNHKMVTLTDGSTVEAFFIWRRRRIEVSDKCYANVEFGWEKVLVPLKEYLKNKTNIYINSSSIVKVEKLETYEDRE